MFILSIFLCKSTTNLDFYEYDVPNYIAFRDLLPKNHFLVTLAINSTSKYQFYKKLFIEIGNEVSNYTKNEINFSFILMIDPYINSEYEAIFYVYLPGVSEKEVSIYPRLSIAFNANKIVNNCLSLIIALRKIDKEQKVPEIERITKELSEITKIIKTPIVNCTYQNLMKDYSSLTNELMHYIPENLQKEKKLLLKQQMFDENSFEYRRIEKEILNERKINVISSDNNKISPHKIDKMNQKYLIKVLKDASDDLSFQVIKSAFYGLITFTKRDSSLDL